MSISREKSHTITTTKCGTEFSFHWGRSHYVEGFPSCWWLKTATTTTPAAQGLHTRYGCGVKPHSGSITDQTSSPTISYLPKVVKNQSTTGLNVPSDDHHKLRLKSQKEL